MDDALRERVETLERAVTDGDHDLSAFADEAKAVDRLETLEADVADLADRIEELEAAAQALRGYVGNVRSVNTDVEQRADAALARVEALESRLPGDAGRQPAASPPGGDSRQHNGAANGTTQHDGPGDDTAQRDSPGAESDGTAGAVDDWEWGTDDSTDGAAGEHGDESGSRGTEPGEAPAGDGRVAPASAGRSSGAPGTGGGTRPQEHAGSEQSGTGVDADRHAARAGHADAGRCASCGRPRETDDASGSPAPRNGKLTAGGDAQRVPVGGGPTPGAPTVAAVAEHDPGGTDPEGSHGGDGDVLPDGADDPLVGTAGEEGGTGALQRIRDLL